MDIKRKYIVNEHNHRIAVQIDIRTFKIIEEILENYALVQLMQETKENNNLLDLKEASIYYQTLEKAK